ncbi:MAG: Trehalose utilization, partial [Verrucomicrobiaceae bacterium]|nr:Trehalose utilization [Verrucomicrobiaceae bacterium]
MTPYRFLTLLALLAPCLLQAETPPLHVLLVAGGCCHDYATQHSILSAGIQARANVVVDVVLSEDKGTTPRFPMYEKAGWAKGYDVVIHDECAAGIGKADMEYVHNIIDAHKNGVPAVNLHCAMHCYRTGTDDWFKYLGLQSSAHNWQKPIALDFLDKEHPITQGMTNWTTIQEELYNNINLFGAHPLIMGTQQQKQADGSLKDQPYVVAWTNDFNGTRIFSTTIGHNNETVGDARYLELVTRGLLWAANKLNADYLKPYTGPAGKLVVLPAPVKKEEPKAAAAAMPAVAPKDATLVTATASSEESGKGNYAWKAVDGNADTRWCANSSAGPQWIELKFEKPQDLDGIKIVWESTNNAYKHKIEASTSAHKVYDTLVDDTAKPKAGDSEHSFAAKSVQYLKITCTGSSSGGWASIREITVKGPGIKVLAPKVNGKQSAEAKPQEAKDGDLYAKEGNIKPAIARLTPDQEKKILSDVKVPEGFDLTLFASPPAANYPVYVSAAANGDLYVSSDGNGSLGRNPRRGRILRLRDTDGDGRADEVKEFVKDVDSPRGLVFDHDRVYLIHPPDISVYIDKDGDGVADEEHVLIKFIAFGFADRPADHTTNGLSMGIDGWLYIAGGDFGFMDAVGTDGKHLQHRGGGVIRFRPDGSGLEIFGDGTRNILGTPISPILDIFARDNTNDGGGWDVRFHHFTGLEDHGYPRLYKNFGDEHIQPLADYGGGAGCGSVYLSEPGFGKWNDAPLTCDWGTGALWHHNVSPKGSTFVETAPPEKFIAMTRPTDADVDGLSHIYQASWKGATFNWEGPDVGYIVRVSPTGFKPEPLLDVVKATDAELVKQLESPSQVRTMDAQRMLLRRPESTATTQALLALAGDKTKALPARVAALYAVTQRGVISGASPAVVKAVAPLAADPALQRFVLRSLGDMGLDALTAKQSTAPVELYAAGLNSKDPRTHLEAIVGATRQNMKSLAPQIAASLGDADAVIAHTSFRALAMLNADAACFAVVDNYDAPPAQRAGALRALMRMHTPEVVKGLMDRLAKETGTEARKGLLGALCRLNFVDGEWKGDSWGTRPDTRGPYYQPDPWSETAGIGEVLKAALAKAPPDEATFLVAEMSRNRIQSNDALDRILALATKDPKLAAEAVAQLNGVDTIPTAAVPLLIKAAEDPDAKPGVLAGSIAALAKTDSAGGARAMLIALVALDKTSGFNKDQDAGTTAFLTAPKLENVHQALEAEAAKVGTPTAAWAEAGLLTLAARKTGSPEAREMSQKALDEGWTDTKRRLQIIRAAGKIKSHAIDDKILAAMDDSDKTVASNAKNVANALKLQKKTKESGPLISTLKPEEVIAQVINIKGDAS